MHYLFLIASTGGAERLFSIKGGVLESRVVGGTGVIVDRLTAELGDRVLLNAPVRQIDQTGPQVRLTSDHSSVSADHVIVAVPPTIAGRIDYDPPLPMNRDHLTQRSPMGWGMKVFAAYPTPFWREAGLNGFVTSIDPDSVLSGVFDNSPPDGKPGVLYGLIRRCRARVGTAAGGGAQGCRTRGFRQFLRVGGARADRVPGARLGKHALDSGWGEHGPGPGHLDRVWAGPPCTGRSHPLGRNGDGRRAVGEHGRRHQRR